MKATPKQNMSQETKKMLADWKALTEATGPAEFSEKERVLVIKRVWNPNFLDCFPIPNAVNRGQLLTRTTRKIIHD